MDTSTSPSYSLNLTWVNVGLSLVFILLNALISSALNLGIGAALVTSAFRCILQLALMGLVLQKVFETNNPWVAGAIAFVLIFLGTFEAVVNKSKKRYNNMFLLVLLSMLGSTIPLSIVGARYALSMDPFWTPDQYIPVVGMLCGNAVTGVVVTVSYVLKEILESRDKIETYLTFGASRFEACSPIIREALRLALTPTINSMSVIGMISIPGMMTGALLGGASVEQAVKLQIIKMFMFSASTALASILMTIFTLFVVVDSEHRVRPDRIDVGEHVIWRTSHWVCEQIVGGVKGIWVEGYCYRRWSTVRNAGKHELVSMREGDDELTEMRTIKIR